MMTRREYYNRVSERYSEGEWRGLALAGNGDLVEGYLHKTHCRMIRECVCRETKPIGPPFSEGHLNAEMPDLEKIT